MCENCAVDWSDWLMERYDSKTFEKDRQAHEARGNMFLPYIPITTPNLWETETTKTRKHSTMSVRARILDIENAKAFERLLDQFSFEPEILKVREDVQERKPEFDEWVIQNVFNTTPWNYKDSEKYDRIAELFLSSQIELKADFRKRKDAIVAEVAAESAQGELEKAPKTMRKRKERKKKSSVRLLCLSYH